MKSHPRLNKSRSFCYEETLRSKKERDKSVTLIELLIAIVLMSLVILGFSSIDLFSRYHVLTADRRAQVQNEASYALEHMAKNIVRAIGNEMVNTANTVVDIKEETGGNEKARIKIYIDASGNGIREAPKNNPGANEDHWIAYRYNDNSHSTPSKRNQLEFCDRCQVKTCNNCMTNWETLSIKANRVSGLVLYKPHDANDRLTDNYLEVEITTCWDPAKTKTSFDCGTSDNPSVTVRNRIQMPSVSTN